MSARTFLLGAPSDDSLRALLAAERDRPFTYADVGATRDGAPPPGYAVDRNRVRLGEGAATFERAVAAMRRWTMFDLGWVRAFPRDAPIETGAAVAVVARLGGVVSVQNVSRIVYTIQEGPGEDEEALRAAERGGLRRGVSPDRSAGPPRRFGFAYGTLPAHAESGEERFTIEHARDGSVWYDILAFSRPNRALVRLGYPLARALQGRFARGSMRAMAAAAAGSPAPSVAG